MDTMGIPAWHILSLQIRSVANNMIIKVDKNGNKNSIVRRDS